MIEIHNKSTYQRVYNNFSTVFIEAYCGFRRIGMSAQESLIAARIKLQDHVVTELSLNKASHKTVLIAYQNIRKDSNLIEKAFEYYKSMK